MKKLIIFTILIIAISSFADEWKPDEWLLTKPISLSLTSEERSRMKKSKNQEEEALVFNDFHLRIFESIPEKFAARQNSIIITPWGTARWEKVSSEGECPKFAEEFHEYSLVFATKYWISPKEQEADFKFGVDDTAEIRHNGKKIFMPLHGGAYKADKYVVPVSLMQGTNTFFFAAINYRGAGMIGARLYPKKSAIYPGLFIETKNPVETNKLVELDFYWMPAAIVQPKRKTYRKPPKCEKIEILNIVGNVITQISGENLDFPTKINMNGKSKGIYEVKSIYNGETYKRMFYYDSFQKKIPPTDKWKRELLKHNDFCSPEALWNQTFVTNQPCAKKIHAYRSKYDNTIEPYVIMLPEIGKFKEGLPLIVVLRPYITSDKIEFMRGQQFNRLETIKLWPFSRGCNGFKGLSERDVLEVIDLVCEEYKIDRNRIYLRGNSLGGYGCWKIGGRHPDLFAAIVASDGYDLTYANNFLNLPIWQLQFKPQSSAYWLLNTINNLQEMGVDAKYTDLHELNEDLWKEYLKDNNIAEWFLSKKRNSQPDKVVYSTYGDVDGAYWVRNIMPEWFGKMGTVVAEIQVSKGVGCQVSGVSKEEIPHAPFSRKHRDKIQGGIIQVRTENVSSYSLDLREGRFLKFKNWEIVIDNKIKTNAVSGEMFSYEFESQSLSTNVAARERSEFVDSCGQSTGSFFAGGYIGGLRKRNGFCGGICDVVCDSFIFAYSAEDEKAKRRAVKFNYAITGIRPNQFDGNFRVIPDTELTPEICQKYNVILFTSNERSGKFMEENIDKFPVYSNQFAFVYPNPLASNRYLLTVTMTNFTPRILMREHNDIISGERVGSFDKNWDKIKWQNKYRSHEHKHNGHNCSECGNQHDKHPENQLLEKEISSKSKRKPWKTYGMIICFLGIAVFYTYDYFVKKKS